MFESFKRPQAVPYDFAVAIGSLYCAQSLAELETDATRKQKMRRVIDKKIDLLLGSYSNRLRDRPSLQDSVSLTRSMGLEEDPLIALFVDLAFINPFCPYTLEYSEKNFDRTLLQFAELFGRKERMEAILKTRAEAYAVHRSWNIQSILFKSLVGLVVIGTGAWIAAPYIATALGAAAGLSGAAATAHGLALLGGGSLAMGGAGMAGGIWLVVGAGAAGGAILGEGSQALIDMGAAAARLEIIKLQVSFKEHILRAQMRDAKAQEAIQGLQLRKREIEERLKEEELLNESNARRIAELQETIKSLENAILWSDKQRKAA